MRNCLEPADLLDRLRTACPDLDRVERRFLVVGGAVRDLLLGRPFGDIDLAGSGAEKAARRFASATTGALVKLGRDVLAVWRVVLPDAVVDFSDFEGAIDDDLRRRDFTINAMALDREAVALVDPFGGALDLEQRLIRMIDEQNLEADPLRCVRAIRFALQCECAIDPATLEAIRTRAPLLDGVAGERIHEEMRKILASADVIRGLDLLTTTGVDVAILGTPIGDATRAIIGIAPKGDATTIWALILGDKSSESVRTLARRLRWSRDEERCVISLMETATLLRRSLFDNRDLPVVLYDAGLEVARRLPGVLFALGADARASEVSLRLNQEAVSIFEAKPALDGDEISSITGLAAGKTLGALRRALLEAGLRGEVTTHDEAVKFVKRNASV